MKKIKQVIILANSSIEMLNQWIRENSDLEIVSIQPYSSPSLSSTGTHWLIEYWSKTGTTTVSGNN